MAAVALRSCINSSNYRYVTMENNHFDQPLPVFVSYYNHTLVCSVIEVVCKVHVHIQVCFPKQHTDHEVPGTEAK